MLVQVFGMSKKVRLICLLWTRNMYPLDSIAAAQSLGILWISAEPSACHLKKSRIGCKTSHPRSFTCSAKASAARTYSSKQSIRIACSCTASGSWRIFIWGLKLVLHCASNISCGLWPRPSVQSTLATPMSSITGLVSTSKVMR